MASGRSDAHLLLASAGALLRSSYPDPSRSRLPLPPDRQCSLLVYSRRASGDASRPALCYLADPCAFYRALGGDMTCTWRWTVAHPGEALAPAVSPVRGTFALRSLLISTVLRLAQRGRRRQYAYLQSAGHGNLSRQPLVLSAPSCSKAAPPARRHPSRLEARIVYGDNVLMWRSPIRVGTPARARLSAHLSMKGRMGRQGT